jgi:diamine N-acetyltransferase
VLSIRPTTADDLAAVVEIESAPDTAQWLCTTGLAWHQQALADTDQDHVVAERDGALTGFVVLAGLDSDQGEIELRRMALAPPARGSGLGRKLLRAAVARAYGDHGARRVWLDVKSHNRRARALYASEGFAESRLLADAVAETDGTTSDLVVMVHTPTGD